MAIRTEQGFAGNSKMLHMNRVAYTVARPAEPETIFPAGTPEKEVVIRIFKIHLQEIMINILRRKICPDAWNVHRLKLKHY